MITDNRTAEQILAGPPQVAEQPGAPGPHITADPYQPPQDVIVRTEGPEVAEMSPALTDWPGGSDAGRILTPGGPVAVADVQPPGTRDLFEIGKHVLTVEARNRGPRPQPVTTDMLLRAVEAMIYAGIADREEKREEFVKQAADFLLTPPDPQEFARKLEEVVSTALAEHATGCKQCGHPHVQHALHEVRRLARLLRPAEPGALLPGFEQVGGRVRRLDAPAAPYVEAGPEPADGVRIMVRLGWQHPTEDFEALFSIASAAAQQAANMRQHDAADATVHLVLPAEVHELGMQITSRVTGDGRVIPLLHAMRGTYPQVEVRSEAAARVAETQQDTARMLRDSMAKNLAAWSEDGGHLLRTEPDVEERARIRIRLRATIATCDRIIGEKHDDRADADADHRDRMRIADAAREDAASIEPGQIVRFDGEEYKIPTMVAAEFLDIDDDDHQSKVNVLLRALAGRQG